MPRTTIADAAEVLLAEHRALAPEDLGRLIAARGLTKSTQPSRAVSRALDVDRRFQRLTDGRWAVPGQLLNGATLTHRLTAGELDAEVLALTPDLAPLVALAPDGLLLPDGWPLRFSWDEAALDAGGTETDTALHGPPGWLRGNSAGDLVHVRLTGRLLRVGPGPTPRTESRLAVRRIVEAARTDLSDQKTSAFTLLPPVVPLGVLILDLLADDPGLLEHPLPPLGEAFSATDLEVHRGFVGLRRTDWAAVDEFMSFEEGDLDNDARGEVDDEGLDPSLYRRLVDDFDLVPAEANAVMLVFEAYQLSMREAGLDRADVASLARMFGMPAVARFLAIHAWIDPDFEPFVAGVAAAAVGPDAAGARYVLGSCAEARNDVIAAEQLFRSALDADREHPLALIEVARYETDRGDYSSALRHLRAARLPPGDAEQAWLEALVRRVVPKVGRNDPCPCGSGRKYKACHLDRPEEIGAVDPAKALMHKLETWLSQPNMVALRSELLEEIGAVAPAAEEGGEADGPIVPDVVLFDRGGLRHFVVTRGALLPEGELALARLWLRTRRSLYEVVSVRPGTSVTLRDLLAQAGAVDTGDVELADRSISRQVQPLDLLCMRLLPTETGGFEASDGITVPRLQRRHVIELLESGDGLDLLRWIAAPGLPVLHNTEAEPLHLIEIAYRVADPSATAAALGKKLRDRGRGRFEEMIRTHGQEVLRGSITLKGDRATIEANSGKRATRLERTLLRAAPGARLIRREERGIEEAMDEERAKGPPVDPIDVAAHPGLAKAMEDFMRKAEANWVEERIPALGGLTPRQALNDVAARPELEAILDDMAWQQRRPGGASGMDPSRVRTLLGIPDRSR